MNQIFPEISIKTRMLVKVHKEASTLPSKTSYILRNKRDLAKFETTDELFRFYKKLTPATTTKKFKTYSDAINQVWKFISPTKPDSTSLDVQPKKKVPVKNPSIQTKKKVPAKSIPTKRNLW